MASKATERQARYDATHTRQIKMKLNTKTDALVIEWLDRQPSIQGAIKALIHRAIAEEARSAEDMRIAATLRRILDTDTDTKGDTTA